ncbi:MAG: radical SAM protein [Magnetococcales bacterium]|nr:radical SAM protein [Magnetococcales bacterium]
MFNSFKHFLILFNTIRNFLIDGLRTSRPIFFVRLLRGYIAVRLFSKARIQYLEIMITHACNAKCDFCSNELYDRRDRKQLLNREKVESIIRQAADMDIPILCFLGGEPLLDPNLFHYLEYTYDHGMMSMVGTNGQFLTEENIKQLKKSHVGNIVVTISSTDKKINDQITNLENYLDNALAGIRRGIKHGIPMTLKAVASQEHFKSGEIQRIIALAKELNIPLSINPVVPTGAALKNYENKTLDSTLQEDLDALVLQHNSVSTHLTNNYFGYGCPAGRAYLGITAFGDIIPCFFMPISYGNIWDTPLQDIFNRVLRSPLFKEGASTCVAAYDDNFIKEVIAPCFDDLTPNKQIPVPIEFHPKFDSKIDSLDI